MPVQSGGTTGCKFKFSVATLVLSWGILSIFWVLVLFATVRRQSLRGHSRADAPTDIETRREFSDYVSLEGKILGHNLGSPHPSFSNASYAQADRDHLHGRVGLRGDGKPGWIAGHVESNQGGGHRRRSSRAHDGFTVGAVDALLCAGFAVAEVSGRGNYALGR